MSVRDEFERLVSERMSVYESVRDSECERGRTSVRERQRVSERGNECLSERECVRGRQRVREKQ